MRTVKPWTGSFCCVAGLAFLGLSATISRNAVGAAADRGEVGAAIFHDRCAHCHGPEGQGAVDGHPDPLVGDASVGELARIISDTMPEDAPESCVGEDALAVADYIHQRFYSPAAQLRNRPPRISLARLTGSQLRQSLADIYGRFVGLPEFTFDQGLRGTYFTGSRWNHENQRLERIDPSLDFDFQDQGPGYEINPQSFYIHWSGGLKADVTGLYELVIESTCSFICELGAPGRVLIDNHVQSGDQTEFRSSVWLTAGRVAPLKIEFVQRERKTEQPPARIALRWVPPRGVEQVIPSGNLLPIPTPGTFSLPISLPPDDRSYGYDRGIRVDREWDDSTTRAALAFADIAVEELWPQFQRQHAEESSVPRALLRDFLARIAETAFRGPLDESQRAHFVDAPVDQSEDDRWAIRRAVLLALKSPRFLYPDLDQDRTPSQRAANRLTLTLYDSLPTDDWLLELVGSDQLQTEAEIRAAADRMMRDFRLQGKLREMLYFWLNLRDIEEMTKDAEAFPDFDSQLVSDLRRSLDGVLDQIVWSEGSDYRQFFVAAGGASTQRLAELYGSAWSPNAALGSTETPRLSAAALPDGASELPATTPRMGILTHPYLMSHLAYQRTTSPIHRGVFLYRHLLGRGLRPPQEAFAPLSPDLHSDLTTRERVALQTSPDSCQVCHVRINGLGFVLEPFDAMGRFRESENGRPIDSRGHYTTRAGQQVDFQGPGDLAEYLAGSDDARQAFVDKAFQYFVKQPPAAYGPETLDHLVDRFGEQECNVLHLIREIAVVAAAHAVTGPSPTNGSPAKE